MDNAGNVAQQRKQDIRPKGSPQADLKNDVKRGNNIPIRMRARSIPHRQSFNRASHRGQA